MPSLIGYVAVVGNEYLGVDANSGGYFYKTTSISSAKIWGNHRKLHAALKVQNQKAEVRELWISEEAREQTECEIIKCDKVATMMIPVNMDEGIRLCEDHRVLRRSLGI